MTSKPQMQIELERRLTRLEVITIVNLVLIVVSAFPRLGAALGLVAP